MSARPNNGNSESGEIRDISAKKQEKRQALKQTVDQAVPDALANVDATKVLSDEEQAQLQERTKCAQADKAAAEELGRNELKKRLTVAAMQNVKTASRVTLRVKQK